jgi:hypothetical protein
MDEVVKQLLAYDAQREKELKGIAKRLATLESYVKKLGHVNGSGEEEVKQQHMEDILSGKGGGLESGGEDMFEKMQRRKAEMLARRRPQKEESKPMTDREKRVAALKNRLGSMSS